MVNSTIRFVLCSQRGRISVESVKTPPETDCGSAHEFLISKFKLKFKKIGEIPRSFRCDLSHIPNDYAVELTIRFKGLDLLEYLKSDGWWFIMFYSRQ